MAFMAPHRRSEYADEPQHMAFRALYPDISLHVWRAQAHDDLLPALARVFPPRASRSLRRTRPMRAREILSASPSRCRSSCSTLSWWYGTLTARAFFTRHAAERHSWYAINDA